MVKDSYFPPADRARECGFCRVRLMVRCLPFNESHGFARVSGTRASTRGISARSIAPPPTAHQDYGTRVGGDRI
jgi:hypothetical protein